jgi:hypothetical protein
MGQDGHAVRQQQGTDRKRRWQRVPSAAKDEYKQEEQQDDGTRDSFHVNSWRHKQQEDHE